MLPQEAKKKCSSLSWYRGAVGTVRAESVPLQRRWYAGAKLPPHCGETVIFIPGFECNRSPSPAGRFRPALYRDTAFLRPPHGGPLLLSSVIKKQQRMETFGATGGISGSPELYKAPRPLGVKSTVDRNVYEDILVFKIMPKPSFHFRPERRASSRRAYQGGVGRGVCTSHILVIAR